MSDTAAQIPITPADTPTLGDRIFRGCCVAAAFVSLVVIGATVVFMVKVSRPALQASGIKDFFTSSVWNGFVGRFGVLGLLSGTVIIAAIAMVVAVPLAVAMALFINEYAPRSIARGLTTPGGFTWNENGVLFVALAGSGGNKPVLPEAPAPLGPLAFGETGAVAVIDAGCPSAIATGIVSTRTAQGRIYGAEAIAELDGQLYLLFSNAGDPKGDHELANGVYRVGGDGILEQIADHAAFLRDYPPDSAPPEGFSNPGNPVAMVAGNGALWVADELNGLIEGLAIPPQVAVIAYPRGVRIRRVRVRAIEKPKPSGSSRKPLIVSRRALHGSRSAGSR